MSRGSRQTSSARQSRWALPWIVLIAGALLAASPSTAAAADPCPAQPHYEWMGSSVSETVAIASLTNPDGITEYAATILRPADTATYPGARPVALLQHGAGGNQCAQWWNAQQLAGHGYVALIWRSPPGANTTEGFRNAVDAMRSALVFIRSPSNSVTLKVRDALGQESTITKPVIPAGQYRPQPGSWSNSSRPGASLDLFATSDGGYTGTWYTFTPAGAPVWYTTGIGYWFNNTWNAPLYVSTWNGSSNVLTLVGSLELKFMSRFSAAFSYTVNGVSGNEPYMQQIGGFDRTGAWYEPARSGWGLNLQEQSGYYGATVAFYEGSQPRWVKGSTTSGPSVSMNLNWMSGPGLCPGCAYVGPPSAQHVGLVSIQIPLNSTSGWTTMNIATPSGARWALPWVNVVKLTQ